ncbi:uncharacterized protein BYT42DRAFT_499188 [Radiomyces spectabilis]|uniref:uncharacterized protein n=1 Tax=Radiomyces spectabilis TaxID=64574 RepID=UPI00221E85FB|nr:uncharacterized protein BYT42DRAFT_499188 [Radiomyces spectabilis]KAI8374584.1 hypothetical protein BYT42DRAFT_499188 [Radiomyces spectabilis]
MADYDVTQYRDSVRGWNEDPKKYLNRYYTIHYYVETKQTQENKPKVGNIYVRQSPNKICVLGFAPDHPIYKYDPLTSRITVRPCTDVLGKKVKPSTVVCEVDIDGHIYQLQARMGGVLKDLNPRLVKEPQLLWEHGMDEGYVAIILPQFEATEKQLAQFITSEAYDSHRAQSQS